MSDMDYEMMLDAADERAEAAEARVKKLEEALKVIAYEPIGEADATCRKVLTDIEKIAKAALK